MVTLVGTYPTLPGLSWPLTRTPVWKTGVQPTQSGRELRASFMSYPLYKWSATYDLLRTASAFTELQTLLAFYNQCAGMYGLFLFTDPDDNVVTTQGFGTGDGVTTQFQLVKGFGGFVEPVGYVVAGATVYNAGVSASVTLNSPSNGWVTFATAPASGHALTWTGSYQYVCRFLADNYDLDRFMTGLYSVKKIEWQSTKP